MAAALDSADRRRRRHLENERGEASAQRGSASVIYLRALAAAGRQRPVAVGSGGMAVTRRWVTSLPSTAQLQPLLRPHFCYLGRGPAGFLFIWPVVTCAGRLAGMLMR